MRKCHALVREFLARLVEEESDLERRQRLQSEIGSLAPGDRLTR